MLAFDGPWAIGSGLIAGVMTAVVLYSTIAFFPNVIRLDVLHAAGHVVNVRHFPGVYYAGGLVFLLGSILAGLAHAGMHQVVTVEMHVTGWAVLFGLGHWIIDGVLLGCVTRPGPDPKTAKMQSAGYFALELPLAATLIFLGCHLLYGAAFAAFYDGLR